MSNGRKNRLKSSSVWFLCLFLLYITANTTGNYPSKYIFTPLHSVRDTIPQDSTAVDSLAVALPDSLNKTTDTLPQLRDSLAQTTDTLAMNLSKDSLDAPIDYSASDSIVFVIPEKKIIFYSQSSVKKGDAELTSDSIEIDQTTNIVTARPTRDSTGKIISKPKMTQEGATMESDLIQYNTKTQRGITRSTITQQGEMYVQGERIKKINVSDFYAYRGQFTTCNLDTPHFAFVTSKMKLVNKKLAVTGPVHPEFEGVPIPIYLPFGIFPISQGRHSGFLPPIFNASEQQGLGLQGLGYYKVLSDNFDVLLRGDVYSYGGWSATLEPTYRKRYRYNGRMMVTLQKNRMISQDPKEDFTDTKTFNVTWSHTVDAKARPGTSFSANVNVSSSKYNRLQTGAPLLNYQNSMNSSITYSKTWDWANLTASANHNQNNNTALYTVSLPTIAFTANTIYPFQKKESAGPSRWYDKLGIGLNSNVANQINFYDTAFSFSKLIDTATWSAQHQIPIQLSLPALGPLQISPGISYTERWYSKRLNLAWIPDTTALGGRVDTTTRKGFYSAREMSFSLSISTALFGKYDKFGKNSKVQAIRHVIRPTISLSYHPDLAKSSWDSVQTVKADGQSNGFENYSYYGYRGAIYGPFSQGRFGGMSFQFDNNLEMKVRSKKDTGDAVKKVKLIDGFGFNGSYNFLADSMRLSPLSLYIRSTLFDQVNITMGGTLNPYKTNTRGLNTSQYAWQGGGFSIGRITNASVAVSTSFKSKAKDDQKAAEEKQARENLESGMTMEEQQSQLEYIRSNPGEFADFNVPWSINLSYSLNYSTQRKPDYTGFQSIINSNLNASADFNLTPKWKMGVNTYYDFRETKIQQLTMFISREMHCWQLSINVTPVSYNRSFNITVSPKSGLLRDLRINRTRSYYGG